MSQLSKLVVIPAVLGLVLATGQAAAAQAPDGGAPAATTPDLAAGPAAVEPLAESETGLYVVRFDEPSLAAYAGGVPGLAPTSPRVTGADRLDVDAPASAAYLDHLAATHDTFAARMEQELDRSVEVRFDYLNALNGMAVTADPAEAARLATLPGVAAVYPDQERELETDVSHDLIGTASIWDGETGSGVGTRGEGMVVAMLDTGVNAAHPAFASVAGDGYVHENPLGSGTFVGVCDPSHPAHEDVCNDKLIGAYNLHPDPESGPSVLDWNDHGSHTGSTMAGNVHEATFTLGQDTFTRTVQGVAPRANVISYLICSPQCPSTAAVAAIDQAIAEPVQVDVINYSISGSDDPWNDPVDLAFLDAYEAGIYISASAGNDGPGPSTVAKTGPWNASVAASTTQRIFAHTVDATGPEPVPPGLAGMPAFPSSDGTQVTADIEDEIRTVAENPLGCDPFPAGAFDGTIALIDRGACTFAVKVTNATDAGAIAVVIANNVGGPPSAPGGLAETTIPAVMIEQGPGAALRDFVLGGTGPAEARINATTELFLDPEAWEDVLAGFSSRGPSQFDVLAPTFSAPGVNILAAGREVAAGPDNYAVISGTSMAAPHGAGAAALLTDLHPDWSQSEVRSALAGTANPDVLRKEDGVTPADPFDQGSGRLDLDAAARVGLVMDETHANFVAANPDQGGDPKTLNIPHLVDHNCVQTCSFTRTVTSVADTSATYTAVVDAAPGGTVTVTPETFTIGAGETQSVEVTVNVAGGSVGAWEFADVRLETSDLHAGGQPIASVHYPIAVSLEPPALDLAPEEITSVLGPDETATETLTIGNSGGEPLDWSLVELTPTVTFAQEGAAAAGEIDISLWNQPVNGTNGIVSDFYNDHGSGVYSADDFAVPAEAEIELIHADGFFNVGGLAEATAISWYIYPDDGGTPAGHPEDGQDAHVFAYTSPPDGAGVTIEDNNVTLDLAAATGGTVTLDTGTYWMVIFPDIDGLCCVGDTRWNWSQGAPQLSEAQLADPGDLFGGGFTDWTSFSTLGLSFTGTAFQLEGTVDCTSGDIPWLDVSPTSGTVDPLGSDEVAVTLDSAGLDAGEHVGTLCLSTNDPLREVVMIPVTLQVEGVVEVPAVEVAPESLAAEQAAGEVTEQALTISNTGDGGLDWNVVAAAAPEDDPAGGGLAVAGPVRNAVAALASGLVAGTGEELSAVADAPAAPAGEGGPYRAPENTTLQSTVLWDQPPDGDSGIVSDFFNLLGGGVYSTDDFVLAEAASVELIHSDGFLNTGSLAEATAISWFVYPDAGGEPAGHPEDGQDAHVWTYSSPPTGPGVDITDNNITLDLVAALGGGVGLPAGTYWLVVFPDINAPSIDGATRWNWFQGTPQGEQARLVDPTDLFGGGISDWTPFSTLGLTFTDTAFRIEGTEGALGCAPGGVPWLGVSPASGSTPAGGSSEVAVTFDSTGLAPGEYEAQLCVSSNDPVTPLVEVPVSLTVVEDGGPGPICDQTIMGVHPGALTVTEGVTCLAAGAMVLGEVNVLPGAGLIAVAAVVQGPVSALGAEVVDVAFSQVTGPVTVSGATGTVSLFGSQVTGSVVLVNSSTGGTPIVVAGNTVIGSLSCTGNEPPPTDHGLPNTVVGGAKLGQCAEL